MDDEKEIIEIEKTDFYDEIIKITITPHTLRDAIYNHIRCRALAGYRADNISSQNFYYGEGRNMASTPEDIRTIIEDLKCEGFDIEENKLNNWWMIKW